MLTVQNFIQDIILKGTFWGVIFRVNPIDFFAPLTSWFCFGSDSLDRIRQIRESPD